MERDLLCEIHDKRRKTCVQCLFFLEIEVEQFFMATICNAAISRNRINYSKNTTRKDMRGRHKKGRGRREGEKRQREKGRERRLLPLSSIPLPFSLPPYPLPLSTPATLATTYIHRVRYFRRLWKNGADSSRNRFII